MEPISQENAYIQIKNETLDIERQKEQKNLKGSLFRKNAKDKKLIGFFNSYVLLGIILVLLGMLSDGYLDLFIGDKNGVFFTYIFPVIVDIIKTLGIAIFLAGTFSFTLDSKTFLEYFSEIIKKIIISKDFLHSIDDNGKKEVLSALLKPSDNQIKMGVNIESYFHNYINKSLLLFSTNFKSNLSLNIVAKYEYGVVVATGSLSYRAFKIGDKFASMPVYFEKSDSVTKNSLIIPPSGEAKEFIEKKVETIKKGGIEYKVYIYEIPDEFLKYPYVTIKREIYEPGECHWVSHSWQSITPYDGIHYNLICQDDLIIKDHKIFDDDDKYVVYISEDKKNIEIITNSWMEAYSGFNIIIAAPYNCGPYCRQQINNAQTLPEPPIMRI